MLFGPNNPPPPRKRRSFGAVIRNQTLQGQELAMFALRVMRGEYVASYAQKDPVTGSITFIDGPPPLDQRMRAAEFLANRGWGRAPSQDQGPEAIKAELADVFAKVRAQLEPTVYKALLVSLGEANGIADGAEQPSDD